MLRNKLLAWLGFSVVPATAPVLFVLFSLATDGSPRPAIQAASLPLGLSPLERALSGGELFIVATGIASAGLGDLLIARWKTNDLRNVAPAVGCFVVAFISALAYSSIASRWLEGQQINVDLVVKTSGVTFFASVMMAVFAIVAAHRSTSTRRR